MRNSVSFELAKSWFVRLRNFDQGLVQKYRDRFHPLGMQHTESWIEAMNDEQRCGCRGDGLLEVLGAAAVAIQPRKGPLHHPASAQDLESLGVVRPLDDLDRPFRDLAQCLAKLFAGIATI